MARASAYQTPPTPEKVAIIVAALRLEVATATWDDISRQIMQLQTDLLALRRELGADEHAGAEVRERRWDRR